MRRPLALVAACAALAIAGVAGTSGGNPAPAVALSAAPTDELMPHAGYVAVQVTLRVTRAPAHRRPTRLPTHRIAANPPKVRAAVAPRPAPLLVERLHRVGSARQVISVVAQGYGTSYATLQGFTKTSSGWQRTFGPWSARIGRNGFAPAGGKREGDGRTPSGSYGFSFMFGVRANPGVRYEYRSVTGGYDVWDDDPSSTRYNLWTDTRTQDAGRNPESMNQVPAYNYSAVIAYNTARTPGLGSAIFLHVGGGSGTAGCVSLPTGELLDVLRWLDPSKSPRIIMGTASSVT